MSCNASIIFFLTPEAVQKYLTLCYLSLQITHFIDYTHLKTHTKQQLENSC